MIYFRFLDEVQSHANENKMSAQNLATVFGPNILRAKMEDPVSMMEGEANHDPLLDVEFTVVIYFGG